MKMNQEDLIDSAVNAVYEGDLDKLKKLASFIPGGKVSEVLSSISHLKKIPQTPLDAAITRNDFPIAKFLVEDCLVNPTAINLGITSLSRASLYKSKDMVELLIKAATKLKLINVSPLYIACESGNMKLARELIEKGEDINQSKCLVVAIDESRNNKFVKYLLERGADVNVKDDNGNTALHTCSYKGNLEIFKILIEKGANICNNNDGVDPLQLAALEGRGNILSFYSETKVHRREEILNFIDLKGVYLVLINDIPSSVKFWNTVFEVNKQIKESVFLEKLQKDLQHIQTFDHLIGDKSKAVIYSMSILERIFGVKANIFQEYFKRLVQLISIKNIEFWEAIQTIDWVCSDFSILYFCNDVFAEKFRAYIQKLNYNNINSSMLNMAITFINTNSLDPKWGSMACTYDIITDGYTLYHVHSALLVLCMSSIKENVKGFDNDWLHSITKGLINSIKFSYQNIFQILIRFGSQWGFPDNKVYETFEMCCKIAADKVNNLDLTGATPLCLALENSGNNIFIDILLKYGAVTDMMVKDPSIRKLAFKQRRWDICTGSPSLQNLTNAKMIQCTVDRIYVDDLPSIIIYFIIFHCDLSLIK